MILYKLCTMSGDFVDSLFISHIGNLTNVINHLTFRERPHTTEYYKKTTEFLPFYYICWRINWIHVLIFQLLVIWWNVIKWLYRSIKKWLWKGEIIHIFPKDRSYPKDFILKGGAGGEAAYYKCPFKKLHS